MSILHSSQTEALIQRIVGDQSNLPLCEGSVFSEFARAYYYGVPYDELCHRDVFDLRGAALAHWELSKVRQPEEYKIRLYCPEVERDGWRSKFAVLEMVIPDQPFLVDTMSMVLKKRGHIVHLTVHPVLAVQRNQAGLLQKIAAPLNADFLDGVFESFLHFEFDRPVDESEFESIEVSLREALHTLELVVEDWKPMRQHVKDTAKNLKKELQRSGDSELED